MASSSVLRAILRPSLFGTHDSAIPNLSLPFPAFFSPVTTRSTTSQLPLDRESCRNGNRRKGQCLRSSGSFPHSHFGSVLTNSWKQIDRPGGVSQRAKKSIGISLPFASLNPISLYIHAYLERPRVVLRPKSLSRNLFRQQGNLTNLHCLSSTAPIISPVAFLRLPESCQRYLPFSSNPLRSVRSRHPIRTPSNPFLSKIRPTASV